MSDIKTIHADLQAFFDAATSGAPDHEYFKAKAKAAQALADLKQYINGQPPVSDEMVRQGVYAFSSHVSYLSSQDGKKLPQAIKAVLETVVPRTPQPAEPASVAFSIPMNTPEAVALAEKLLSPQSVSAAADTHVIDETLKMLDSYLTIGQQVPDYIAARVRRNISHLKGA